MIMLIVKHKSLKRKKISVKLLLVTLICLLSVSATCTTNINSDFCLLYEPIYADYTNDTHPTDLQQIKLVSQNITSSISPKIFSI